ncbi:hypothetical protein WMZ97_20730 [Lentibacillus sp. N15]|uniref:ATP-grasp domain-containing protein n=1 Tax=Lentibacillus songyuanensis TaxID=3136161 RepID=UPI0031B9B898
MSFDGWLLYKRKDAIENQAYIDWFVEEAHLAGMSLTLVCREDLTIGIIDQKRSVLIKNQPVKLPDYAVSRTIDHLLSLQLEALEITVFNAAHIAAMCNNKALTHQYICDLQIPMVDTIFLERASMPLKPPLPYPFVLKETGGHGGQQVYYIAHQAAWEEHKATISGNQVIIQACNVVLGKDVRVFVVGKEIVGAVLRENKADFRANYKLGGSVTGYSLSQKETAMINRIIRHFDFDMVGIDFLIDIEGNLVFNEVEDVVGSRTLSIVSDVNILEIYCRHMKEKLSMKKQEFR